MWQESIVTQQGVTKISQGLLLSEQTMPMQYAHKGHVMMSLDSFLKLDCMQIAKVLLLMRDMLVNQ